MKELVMKVDKFFITPFRSSNPATVILGGVISCDSIYCGDSVEIHTSSGIHPSNIYEIMSFNNVLEYAKQGMRVGISFQYIDKMKFRTTEPLQNPHDPKTHLNEYLEFNRHANDAEEVSIYRDQKS